MKLALEALESCGWNDGYAGENQYFHDDLVDKAIAALREALAEQPAQQEPLFKPLIDLHPGLAEELKAINAPAQRKPLTPAEVHGMAEAHGIDGDARHWYVVGLVDAQAKHNIKEQP